MPFSLDDNIYRRVRQLCQEGDDLAGRNDFESALDKYEEALALLPAPLTDWEAATWIFAALGDVHFLSGNLEKAYSAFSNATNCPGGVGNPFIHLRLGQIQFRLGNEIVALDELARAYMGGGREIFDKEDPKYFDLVKRNLKEPQGGW